MLMQSEAFAEQPSRAAADHRGAYFFTGDDAEFRLRTFGQLVPVDDQAALGQPFASLSDTRKITTLGEPYGAAQTQRADDWGRRGHGARKLFKPA